MKGIAVALSIVCISTLPLPVRAQSQSGGSPYQNFRGTTSGYTYNSQQMTGIAPSVSPSVNTGGVAPGYGSAQSNPGAPPAAKSFSWQSSQSQQFSKKKQPGPLRRFMHAAADEVGGTAAALVGATIGDCDTELPPDTEQNPSWPFSAPRRKALYTVYWTDGTTAKISKSPEGTFSVTGGGHSMTLQKEAGGVYALLGEDGSMGTLSPRPGGGYTLMKGDGSTSVLLPRPDGGFSVVNAQGAVVATIVPGPGGSRHVFSGNL
jgi:hypothetical protein